MKRPGLRKIAAVYGLVEELNSQAARVASVHVREAETAIQNQVYQAMEIAAQARQALFGEQPEERQIIESQLMWGALRAKRLEEIRRERERVAIRAQEAYRSSRIRSQQVESVLSDVEAVEKATVARKFQAASDDRFLARLIWNRDQIRA